MRVWVGNLGKYNEGELVGEWITLPMPKNQLDDILSKLACNLLNKKLMKHYGRQVSVMKSIS